MIFLKLNAVLGLMLVSGLWTPHISFAQPPSPKAPIAIHFVKNATQMQATAVVQNTGIPLAHLVTLAFLHEQRSEQISSNQLRPLNNVSLRIKATTTGWKIILRGPTQAVQRWQGRMQADFFPPYIKNNSQNAAQLCERARSFSKPPALSPLWRSFFKDKKRFSQGKLDEFSCAQLSFPALKKSEKKILSTPWIWLFEKPVHSLPLPPPFSAPKSLSSIHSFKKFSPTPLADLQHLQTSFVEAGLIFQAQMLSMPEQAMLISFLKKELSADVFIEESAGQFLLIFRVSKARTLEEWQKQLKKSLRKLTQNTYQKLLAKEKKSAFSTPFGSWSERNASRLLQGLPLEKTQDSNALFIRRLIFPSTLRGAPLSTLVHTPTSPETEF